MLQAFIYYCSCVVLSFIGIVQRKLSMFNMDKRYRNKIIIIIV